MKHRLKLVLENEMGETVSQAWFDLPERTISDLTKTLDDIKLGASDFNTVIETYREKAFRKDLLMASTQKVGAKLCENLEEKEGWNNAASSW